MLTTIFTGHTLRLTDIRAVSALMTEHRQSANTYLYSRRLYLKIHLCDNVVLEHSALTQAGLYSGIPLTKEQTLEWERHYDELDTQRADLVSQWQLAVQNLPGLLHFPDERFAGSLADLDDFENNVGDTSADTTSNQVPNA